MTTPVNLTGHIGVPLDRRLRIAVAGAGARGSTYAGLAAGLAAASTSGLASPLADIVAVAEPRAHHLRAFTARHPGAAVFGSWQDMLAAGRIADAVIIATQDADHVAAATAFADAGYDLLLEKPMATAEADCTRIVAAVERAGVTMAVCHVLRYTPYTRVVKSIVDSGRIGELVAVQHREPIGFWHFAHSFVRGNWRRSDESTFLLLSKSCHDLDWLSYVVGQPAVRVSSFGSLTHFRPESAPPGATGRCTTCPIEPTCAYSAPRIYRAGLASENTKTYFTRIVAPSMTEAELTVALAEGPYGRCVYACDNDVVDHQVVNVEYAGGVTASFTLAAFTRMESRHTMLCGTQGELRGDGRYVRIYDFRTEETETIDTRPAEVAAIDAHDGGDAGLITAFVTALTNGDPSHIVSGAAESLTSHRIVFAAERARGPARSSMSDSRQHTCRRPSRLAVRREHWTWPTPCDEWNVRQLVNHMTRGNLSYAHLVHGGTNADFLRERDLDALGTDPVGAYQESVAVCVGAFHHPGTLDRMLDHPLGKITGAQALAVRTTDSVIHTWDLARATDADEVLHHGLMTWIDEHMADIYADLVESPIANTTGRFFAAPTGDLGPTANPDRATANPSRPFANPDRAAVDPSRPFADAGHATQDRVLRLMGRRP